MAKSGPARDPVAVLANAIGKWTWWMPGDGSRYSVHLTRITEGPDAADLVLLLSIQRRTVAFQVPTAKYRLAEIGPWTRARCREHGIPGWAWRAAKPLLAQLNAEVKSEPAHWDEEGDTMDPDELALGRPIVDVHLPEPAPLQLDAADRAGAIAVYGCRYGHATITRTLVDGLTAKWIGCVAPGCGIEAMRDRLDPDAKPTHEWYRPADTDDLDEHVWRFLGDRGLWLRPIVTDAQAIAADTSFERMQDAAS